jgi:hypothetical protein
LNPEVSPGAADDESVIADADDLMVRSAVIENRQ